MTVLVTGGGGFLGKAIVHLLRERGETVRSFSRQKYASLEALGVAQFQGDLGDASAVQQAVQGCDAVYHVAAKAGVWGPWDEYYRINVVGTENILRSCQQLQVPRLIYTSSPSVVYEAGDQEGVNESVPYPKKYLAHYPHTKAIAEKAVLQANGPGLSTVALRPHLIWGPEDPHLVPRLIARAKLGKLRRIGNASKLVDTIYVDNAAKAHVQAADKLQPNSAVAGKAYFLSQGEPLPLWDFINRILKLAGLPEVTRSVPVGVAYTVGFLMEKGYRLFSTQEPPMTRFVARQLSTAHWFDLTAAKTDFGYAPEISTEEGLRRLANWFQEGHRSVKHFYVTFCDLHGP